MTCDYWVLKAGNNYVAHCLGAYWRLVKARTLAHRFYNRDSAKLYLGPVAAMYNSERVRIVRVKPKNTPALTDEMCEQLLRESTEWREYFRDLVRRMDTPGWERALAKVGGAQ